MEDGNLKYQTNTLRIPLDTNFGKDFFTNGQFGSNEVFLNYLNGIALIPNTSNLSSDDGAIVAIDKYSDESKLILYYNNGLRKEFEINAESQNISTYTLATKTHLLLLSSTTQERIIQRHIYKAWAVVKRVLKFQTY